MKNTKKNIMKTKKDKNYYLTRAVRRFVNLVEYFTITRVRAEKNYFKDGKFNIDKFRHQLKFLNDWENKTRAEKKLLAKTYADYSTTFNYTTGIPVELVKSVLGRYIDDNGVYRKISIEEVENILVKKGVIRVIEAGKKFNRSEDGKYTVKCWWNKKYLFADEKVWFKKMNDDKYTDYWKFIDDKGLLNIIDKWTANFKKEVPVSREELFNMYRNGGIDMKVYVNLDRGLFNTPDERIRVWIYAQLKNNIHFDDKTSLKDKINFWNRIVYGNLKNAEFPYAVEEFVKKEFKKVKKFINRTNIK